MVACSGQGFALDCLPDVAVFHPVTRYRPTLWKMLAIAPKNQHQELSKMKAFAYSFLCAIRTPETDTYQETVVRIISDSEQNARFQLTADYRLLLPRPVAKIRLNSTAYTVKGGFMLNYSDIEQIRYFMDQAEEALDNNEEFKAVAELNTAQQFILALLMNYEQGVKMNNTTGQATQRNWQEIIANLQRLSESGESTIEIAKRYEAFSKTAEQIQALVNNNGSEEKEAFCPC